VESETTENTEERVNKLIQESRIVPIINNPWRTAFWIMMPLFSILCLAVIALGVTMKVLVDDRAQESASDACYDAFTNASSEAIREVRATGTRVNNAGWQNLIDAVRGDDITDEDVERVDDLVEESESALAIDLLRIEQRDAWVSEGRPMPDGECPAPKIDSTETRAQPDDTIPDTTSS
jgi:hypothetical protein